jgi:putative ABC transport system permease protein
MWRNVQIAIRGFRRNPTFSITAVLILGVGIGMASAMWTVFNAVLVQRLPVLDQDRIILPRTLDVGGVDVGMSPRQLPQLGKAMRTVSSMAGIVHWGTFPFALSDGDRPIVLSQTQVTGNFFEVLGTRPALGRLLRADDDSTSRVLVLSYGGWQRLFGGDPRIIGHRLTEGFTGTPLTIVGVAPPGLDYPTGTDGWRPQWGSSDVDVIARLAPGATAAAARSEFFAAVRQMDQQLPTPVNVTGSDVRTLRAAVVGNARTALMVMTAAVGLLLVIVCVNVGNLLLLRATTRAREIAVRLALGASGADIVRQLLLENCLLAIMGGVLGLALADVARRVLIIAAPSELPRLDALRVAGAPVLATIVVALVTVLLFGMLPALAAARGRPAATLREDARSGMASRQRGRSRQLLVASQVALALIMLSGAALLARSLRRLETIRLGYTPGHLMFLQVTYPVRFMDTLSTVLNVYDVMNRRLTALPGVTAVTPVLIPPFLGANVWTGIWEIEGRSRAENNALPLVPMEVGNANYFRTLGIPIVRGRGFLDTDRENAPQVVVVSEAAARLFWPGQDPIGKRLRFFKSDTTWRTVVGVADDIHYRALREATPTVTMPYRQFYWQGMVALRSATDPAAIVPAIRRAIAEVEPDVTVWRTQTMDDFLAGPLAQPRLSALLLSMFGFVALALAALGLYGIMATTVREQTREIGVRMALGATPGQVRGEVLRRAMTVSALGAAVGLAGALAASRVISSLLFQVSPTDPIALASACAALLTVALIAAYLPARHASRVDPARALQAE